MSEGRFDWPVLMAAGMRGLGLAPAQFWSLTPAELAFLLGQSDGRLPMDRARLDALAAQFPDITEEDDG